MTPTPTSLREQIKKLMEAYWEVSGHNKPHKLPDYLDTIMSLIERKPDHLFNENPLRTQIATIAKDNYTFHTSITEKGLDQIMSLVTTYIEAAKDKELWRGELAVIGHFKERCAQGLSWSEICGKFDEQEVVARDGLKRAQAQKAVLGISTDKQTCTCGHNKHTHIVIQRCETCSCQEFTAVLEDT
jgi:hypothetical protein